MSDNVKFLSASRMKTLETCSWQYWCKYGLGLPDTTNSGALRGTICHLILELLLKPRHKKHFDAIINSKTIKASKPVDKVVIKYCKKHDIYDDENYPLVDTMICVGLEHDFFGEDEGGYIEAPEKEFEIKNKNPQYNIRGYIDKPIEYKDEKILKIVDYKTSKAKFKGDDLTSNVQAMMYSLAAKKEWPEMKRRIVQFLFLKFPRSPLQELEFTDEQLKGFEQHLEQVNNAINNFTEDDAKNNYAADNGNQWLCGPAKSGWICPFHLPFDYYVLVDKDGKKIKSAHDYKDLEPTGEESIEMRSYGGCPRKYCAGNTQQVEKDDFDLDQDDFSNLDSNDFSDLDSNDIDNFDF